MKVTKGIVKNKFTFVLLSVFFNHITILAQAQFATPSPLPKPAQMLTDPYNDASQVGYCLDQAGSNSCTANDFTITSIRTLNVDDGCTSPTDYMQIDLEVTFAKQTPTRYDVGAWFYRGIDATSGADFNNEDAINGSFCTRIGVAPGLLTPDGDPTANDPSDDGVCMDVPSGTPGNLSPQVLNDIILPCRDITNATFGLVPDGITDISACTSWQNNAVNGCAGPQYQEFDLTWPNSPFSSEIQPQTGSKCNCAEFDGGPTLVPIPDIEVTKSCTPDVLEPGETTICTITITNNGLGDLIGASSINTSGFFYEDDYPESQGSIGTITPSAGVSAVDGFTKDANANDTANQSLNIYPGTIAASVGTASVVYEFITSPSLPTSETTITNTVCASFYNDNATVGLLPDDSVFQYTSTEPGQCATDTVTTPVSISGFIASESLAGGYDINWSTATETGNLGFNIYAVVGNTKYQMNKHLIPSNSIDSMKIQEYSFYVNSQLNGFVTKFIIEDVDRFGRKQSSEEYEINKQYGLAANQISIKNTNWEQINTAHKSRQNEVQLKRLAKFETQFFNKSSSEPLTIDVKITESGIHKVSYFDLQNLGVNLNGLKSDNIGLIYQGNLIPIDFIGLGKKNKFGKDSILQFYAESINTLYTDTNIYELKLFTNNPSPKVIKKVANPRGRTFAKSYPKTVMIDRNLHYSFGSPIKSEPWFDTKMFAYQSPLSVYYDLNTEDIDYSEPTAFLTFEYWGGLDFPTDDNDHSINFSINNNHLGSDIFDGIIARKQTYPIASSVLNISNDIKIELPASNQKGIDLISLESIALTYSSLFKAKDDYLSFEMPFNNFSVSGLSSKSIQVFALQDSQLIKFKKFKIKQNADTFNVEFSGLSGNNHYFVVTENSVKKPQLSIANTEYVSLYPTEHLIISHADFIGDELKNYISSTRQNYRIIDVESIYSKYSNKLPSGEAIKQFIQETAFIGHLKSVLLVGGDTYDYKNNLGLNTISFIPTIYRETDDLIKFSAVDSLFGDTNEDSIPDVAVGRLPVRTMNELNVAINKLDKYVNNQSTNFSVVLAADNSEPYDSYNFSDSSNLLATQLENANWSVEKAYLDELSIEEARDTLLSEMNSGVRLAMYTGHSSSNRWAFEGLFRNSDVQSLTNYNNPLGIIQWGCWNTYFVEPEEDSLGHEFMLSGSQGAAFVIGASTLTNAGLESRFSNLFNIYMMNNNLSIGEAMIRAKREFHDESSSLHKDILWGISLLGDPVIRL